MSPSRRADLIAAEPTRDLLEIPPLLVVLHGEAFEQPRLWGVLANIRKDFQEK